MAQRTWEVVIPPKTGKTAATGVRRMRVPNGFLYQIEHHVEADGNTIIWVEWSTPVYVPFHGDGDGS